MIDNKSTSHSNDASDCVKWWKARRTLPDCGPQERMAFCGRADCAPLPRGRGLGVASQARFHCDREEEYEQQERGRSMRPSPEDHESGREERHGEHRGGRQHARGFFQVITRTP